MRHSHICAAVLLLAVHCYASPEDQTAQQRQPTQTEKAQQSTPTITPQPTPKAPDTYNEEHGTDPKSPNWLNGLYLVAGVCTLFVSIGTGIVVWKQVHTLRQVERAWITVDAVSNETIGLDGRLKVVVTYINHGRTPAWVYGVWWKYDFYNSVPANAEDMRKLESLEGPHPLSPGSKVTNIRRLSLDCRPTEKIIILGIAKYRDVFGKNRSTRFGYIVADDLSLDRLPAKFNQYT